MRTSTCLLPKVLCCAFLALALAVSPIAPVHAQSEVDSVIPASYEGSGGFFNKKLGTALRFNYHTHGYGTQDDVFSLGGMKIFNLDGATVFLDGQGTLSDDFGGGFNLGVGYRQLTTTGMNFDPQRILGVGFWTDGQSTASDNFFTQLGFSLESLGDSFDLRLNGSFPLERTQTSDAVLTGTGTPFYMGNNIFGATEQITIDTAHTVVDGEFAKRINDLEAWAFVGGYQLGGGGVDATGYRAGVRGYAVPDLALSLQVTDDDVYATNVMFGLTWFIGRTHKGNAPCGNLLDRFREPVLRNDFIAMTSRHETRASGNALTATGTTDAIRVVHIDRNDGTTSAGGGDGTYENPFRDIADIDAANVGNSMEGDILLVHATSDFTGAEGIATLQANQQLLGEGIDQNMNEIPHVVATNELGNINLPETAAGAQALARPTIDGGAATVITLADNNTVNNFTINNAGTAVLADTVATPTLQNLQINDAATGVSLRDVTGTSLVENTVEINRATATALNVDLGQDGMSLAATINDSTGTSLAIQNRLGGTIDFTGTIDDDTALTGTTFSDGVLINNNSDSTINLTNTHNIRVEDGSSAFQVTNNATSTVNASGTVDLTANGTGEGLLVDGNDENTNVTFDDLNATAVNNDTVRVNDGGTVTLSSVTTTDPLRGIANTGTGRAFANTGHATDADRNATVTVNSNITNTGGGLAVEVQDRSVNTVAIAGTVEATSAGGVSVHDNIGGEINFSNTLTLNTGTFDAVALANNTDGTTDATIRFSELDIDTTSGDGFVATGGGNLVVTNAVNPNAIDVTGDGAGLTLTDMTIDASGVTFDTVNVNNAGGGVNTGIDLQNLEGTGQVAIGGGTNPGDGGTLTTDGTAINIDNAENVAMTNMTVNNTGAAAGLVVSGQQTGSSVNFTGLDVTTSNANAVDLNTNDDGAITFNTLTASTTGSGDGISLNNADGSTVSMAINNATVNATGSGKGFTATGGGTTLMAGTNEVNSSGDTAFDVDNVESLTASNVTINNTTAAGVNVANQDGATDSVTLNNFDVTTTDADAVTVANNTDGTVVLNSLTANSTLGDTVVVNNNTGATVSFNNMTATATSGDTFAATGGGTLIATGTNNVTTDTGQAVNIDGMTIDGAGVALTNVNVTNGAGTGVNLNNLTGGQVTIGNGTTASAINTSLDGIVVTNAANVDINNVDVTTGAAGVGVIVTNNDANDYDLSLDDVTVGSGGASAIAANHTGAGAFTFSVTNSDFDDIVDIDANGAGNATVTFNDSLVDTTGNDVAFTLMLDNSVSNANVQIRGSQFTSDDATAFDFDTNSVGLKSVTFELTDSMASNDSASATAEIDAAGATVMNTTVTDNVFSNVGAGDNFDIAANSANTVLNLLMTGNASNGGTDSAVLRELNVADFNIVDRTNFESDNAGIGNFTYDSAGNVIGDFDDIPALP